MIKSILYLLEYDIELFKRIFNPFNPQHGKQSENILLSDVEK